MKETFVKLSKIASTLDDLGLDMRLSNRGLWQQFESDEDGNSEPVGPAMTGDNLQMLMYQQLIERYGGIDALTTSDKEDSQ